ncbi:uncharacterized protein EI97DRAFT_154165 [Westerdykella ornata]|uniref:C2H2 type master regulator of conidiophore development brlA n=1 Tax=Westerdykella ornata TaxID=318751 RepID=A0A6A6JBJ4_WESOR|nr:uncharacterized protein EI97DRAFT_154165 [Westerdykella ornata]KAF2273574.1 hypothetical protein EI97DRAFT_154165 [Westerdykella ornata]
MSDKGQQPTPPFNSPYQHAMRPTSMLQPSAYPSPARSDSEPSKYTAEGLGLYSLSHSFATSGPSTSSVLYTPSSQSTEHWSRFSSSGSPLVAETPADLWARNYDHRSSHSSPSWAAQDTPPRSSISSTKDMSTFSREGSAMIYAPHVKLEGGSEWASEGESSPPNVSHQLPLTVAPERLTTGIFPYDQAYGSPAVPRYEPASGYSYRHYEDAALSHEERAPSPRTRESGGRATARTRVRRNPTTPENANYSCATCGKLFQRSYNHKTHLETHNPARKKEHCCQYRDCDKQFVRKTDLDRHEKSVHLKRKDFRCRKCDAQFARKDTLRRHEEDGCPKRNELTDPTNVLSRTRAMRASSGIAYYPSPRADMYDTRSPPLFRDGSFPGTPSGY